MSTLLTRGLELETVTVELQDSTDGQGAPTYASPENIQAYVVEEDKVVVSADGTEHLSVRTVYVGADQTPAPQRNARLTMGGDTFIVLEIKRRKRLSRSGGLDHTQAQCREE